MAGARVGRYGGAAPGTEFRNVPRSTPLAASFPKWIGRSAPVLVPLILLAATTGVLYVLDVFLDPEHLIFGYLVPTTLIAIGYGSTAAMLASIAGVILAAYFLYEPTFSFFIRQPLHMAELVFFTLLALAASQVVARITHDPPDK
jgi:K+-sensing histidine kinase KdpD